MRRSALLLCLSSFALSGADFETEIAPIFKRSCYGCHSSASALAGLRLDSRADALKVIAPGKSDASKLMQRISGTSAGPRMPMGGRPLDNDQIATLRKWIDEGAPWSGDTTPKKHWAYIPPSRPTPPAVRNTTWARNAMDPFVLAGIEKAGLQPSAPASKETLIRRVSLDLTGLPPTLREIDDFLADTRADAYERLVDRLLASPHFGERWARPWLDLARYADTNGYEKDRRRSVWKYRDYVIDALNQDMPFDRFTIEQLAGDMLPNATNAQRIATGFHRNTMFNEEGGVDKDEAFWESLVDRVGTTSTVWLGSTLGCAQCHNHKFDPFSQKDFYRMMAFFNNGERTTQDYGDTSQKWLEPELALPTADQQGRRRKIEDEIRAVESRIQAADLAREQAEWERSIAAAGASWTTLQPSSLTSANGALLKASSDGSILATGPNTPIEIYSIESKASARGITGIRIEALPDSSLPRGGPGRDVYGNFFLKSIRVEGMQARDALSDDGPVRFGRPSDQLWGVDASRDNQRLPRQLVLVAAKPLNVAADHPLRIDIRQESEFGGLSLGRFRISYTTDPDPAAIVTATAKIRPLLNRTRTAEEDTQVATFFRGRALSLKTDRDRLKELRKQMDELGVTTTLVFNERASFTRPSTQLRIGGQFLSPGETVYAATPAVLNPMPESELPNRLGLARWIVSRDNPLTARVAVNRIWEQYFGRGIVETSEDFGSQGERPTNPDLLDWLAVEFMDRGWSMKAIHRLIVTSAAYRQDSRITPELLEKDPYNKLIARGPRFRMEAEMVRDSALSASGLLSAKIGGPSVFPPQPEGVWDLPYNDDKWTESKGEDRYRRGIYTFIRRTAPYPSMLTFDGVSRESCTVRRIRTNTPLQALTTMNDPAFFETAQAMARRVTSEGGPDDRARVVYGFRLATGRKPKSNEMDRLLSGLEKERTYFAAHTAEAERIAANNDLAAWTTVCNALLNLDEAVTKE